MNVGTTRTLANSWLLLIHRLPAKPAYLRVKIWRGLQGVGAVAVKNPVLSVAAAVVIFRFKVIIPTLAAFCFAGIVPYLVGTTS